MQQKFSRLSVLTFWRLFTLRHARMEWLQTLLLLLILGLGVGTFLSIRIANRAAMEGFQLFTETLRGSSDWIIESRGDGIPVEMLPRVRAILGNLPSDLYPVIEETLEFSGQKDGPSDRPPLRLIALDLVQIRELTDGAEWDADNEFWDILNDASHILLGTDVANYWKDSPIGRELEFIKGGELAKFTIKGILPEQQEDGRPVPANLALVDIGSLLKRFPEKQLDRIEVVIPPGIERNRFVEQAGAILKAELGDTFAVSAPQAKAVAAKGMTAAFRLNLTVLSLIALLVGIYLIAQTLDATVSRRRKEIATLRSLGMSPRSIYKLWLSEALLYGIFASIMGLFCGLVLSTLTVDAVTTTVRTLYRDTVGGAAELAKSDVVIAFLLGISGSLVAAWLPAKDAASTPPAQFLRIGNRIPPFPIFNHPWVGLAAILMGTLLLLVPPWRQSFNMLIPVGGYASAFLWLVGGTLLVVQLLKAIGVLITKLNPDSAISRLAGGRLQNPTSRHQLALAGFYVAIGMASSISFLLSSFENTVTAWLKHRLQADVFISSVGFQGSDNDERMPGHLLDAIESDPAVAQMDRFRLIETAINGNPTGLGGMRFDLIGTLQDLLWIEPPRPSAKPQPGEIVGYANENLVRRASLEVGDTVQVETPQGIRSVSIAGIHADYARDNGLLIIDLPILEDLFQTNSYDTASVFLHPNQSTLRFRNKIRQQFPGLSIRDNPELMEAALDIFDQTFAVTKALQLIGITVAISGLVLGLISLLRESDRELSLQVTLGMSRRECAKASALEGLGIAFCGVMGGIILSFALGNVMIHVINKQSFGWTLQSDYPVNATLILTTAVLILSYGISYLTGSVYLRKWKPQPF